MAAQPFLLTGGLFGDCGGSILKELLTFRRLVAPVLVQALSWLATAAVIVVGLAYLIAGAGARGRITGLLTLLLGPLVIRVGAELMLVLFRINATLRDIKQASEPKP